MEKGKYTAPVHVAFADFAEDCYPFLLWDPVLSGSGLKKHKLLSNKDKRITTYVVLVVKSWL